MASTAGVTIFIVLFCSMVWRAKADCRNTALQAISEKMPGLSIPEELLQHLSPLMEKDVENILTNSWDAETVCTKSGFVCNPNVPYIVAMPYVFLHVPPKQTAGMPEALQWDPNVFFPHDQLKKGGRVTLPDLKEPLPRSSFLPKALADHLPVTEQSLPMLLTLLGIPHKSNMFYTMASTAMGCNQALRKGEIRTCISSMESMIDYVYSILGSNVELLYSPSIAGSKEPMTITKVETKNGLVSPVSCHSFAFPYAVYYCHYLHGTKVFELSLVSDVDGKEMKKYAICHKWMPSLRQEFEQLNVKEGGWVCHWLFGNNLLWIPSMEGGDHATLGHLSRPNWLKDEGTED